MQSGLRFLRVYYRALQTSDLSEAHTDLTDEELHQEIVEALKSLYPAGKRETPETKIANEIIGLGAKLEVMSLSNQFQVSQPALSAAFLKPTPVEVRKTGGVRNHKFTKRTLMGGRRRRKKT